MKERFRWLAAAIAAHPGREVVGRTRLQKEIRLLQRLSFPTDYSYTIHFYGPYSHGLQAEIGLVQALGLIEEEARTSRDGTQYFILRATPEAELREMGSFQPSIDLMQKADATVLELAATYDAFRIGAEHDEAMARLRRKKGHKCDAGNAEAALDLLQSLGLPSR